MLLFIHFWTKIAVYAAISSHSLSLLATGIDSVFDIGSNVLLFWLHRKAAKLDSNKWPVGGARLETIGNIIYGARCPSWQFQKAYTAFSGFLWVLTTWSLTGGYINRLIQSMGSVNFVVIVESARTLISKKGNELAPFHLPSIIAVATALGRFSSPNTVSVS
jgi:hypothetical protein